jgi:hypothetical protein
MLEFVDISALTSSSKRWGSASDSRRLTLIRSHFPIVK